METEQIIDFIKVVENHLGNKDFKVLYGIVTGKDDVIVEFECNDYNQNTHTINIPIENICYPTSIKTSPNPVLIAVQGIQNYGINLDESLGHPTTLLNIQNDPQFVEERKYFF